MSEPQRKPYRVHHGGLFRCCLLSLDNAMLKHHVQMTEPKGGDVVRCEWCSDQWGMVLRDDTWRWAAPASVVQP